MKRYIRSTTVSNLKLAINSTDPKVLAQLANDEDRVVRRCVASNLNTPASVLAHLANVDKWDVVSIVVENPNTPVDILEQVANDKNLNNNLDVTLGLAQNPNTPADILAQLATIRNPNVRKCVVQNPNTPADVLAQLANDDAKSDGGRYEPNRKLTNTNWPNADYWDNIDGYEEMNDAWETYLADPEDEINVKLQIYPETSVRMGLGSMFIHDESGDDNESVSIDYQDWCDAEIEMASESKSAKEYATKYEAYLKSIIDWL